MWTKIEIVLKNKEFIPAIFGLNLTKMSDQISTTWTHFT